ncbi:MAG: hypothetical protein J0M29_05515 [Chitinophagales bacterium]|nr:hypothetical protein [Chitinophagales bacterium]
MKDKKKRLLKHYLPDILNGPNLPANYQFAQLFTLSSINENGTGDISSLDSLYIEVSDYQTEKYTLMSTLGKPISKIIR